MFPFLSNSINIKIHLKFVYVLNQIFHHKIPINIHSVPVYIKFLFFQEINNKSGAHVGIPWKVHFSQILNYLLILGTHISCTGRSSTPSLKFFNYINPIPIKFDTITTETHVHHTVRSFIGNCGTNCVFDPKLVIFDTRFLLFFNHFLSPY